jgi:hypothetical protein
MHAWTVVWGCDVPSIQIEWWNPKRARSISDLCFVRTVSTCTHVCVGWRVHERGNACMHAQTHRRSSRPIAHPVPTWAGLHAIHWSGRCHRRQRQTTSWWETLWRGRGGCMWMDGLSGRLSGTWTNRLPAHVVVKDKQCNAVCVACSMRGLRHDTDGHAAVVTMDHALVTLVECMPSSLHTSGCIPLNF